MSDTVVDVLLARVRDWDGGQFFGPTRWASAARRPAIGGFNPSRHLPDARRSGEGDLAALQYVLYEDGGRLTMVRADQQRGEAIRAGLAEAGIATAR